MPDKVISIVSAAACCCGAAVASVNLECRSKSGTAAGLEPAPPTDATAASCDGRPYEGDFSYEVEDVFGVTDPSSANYGAPNLPEIKMTVSFHAALIIGPDSCDPVESDDGFCLEGGNDTSYEVTGLVVEFDDVDVDYTPPTLSPVNLGWCPGVVPTSYYLGLTGAISYYDPITENTYTPDGGTSNQLSWPALCAPCWADAGANVLPENRLPAIIADENPWDGSNCDQTVSAASGDPSSFTYEVVQFRALCSGLTNGVDYDVTVEILQYEPSGPMGAGWFAYAEVHYTFTASGTTHTGSWVDLTTELSLGAGQFRVGGATIAAA